MPLPTKGPVLSFGGAMLRYCPIMPVAVLGPFGSRLVDGCVDCGSDDTIFPMSLARKLRLDLTGAPQGESHPVGGAIVPFVYAAVCVRVSDGYVEHRVRVRRGARRADPAWRCEGASPEYC